MEKDDLRDGRIHLPEPKIEKLEGKLKAKLEESLGKICPLTLRRIYEEFGPFGVDMIFYDCQKGGRMELREKALGPHPCSLEYADHCRNYNEYTYGLVNS